MIPDDIRTGAVSRAPRASDDANAAAAAEAARAAAQPLSPTPRAIEGFRIAAGDPPPGAGPQSHAIADAAANARTILSRTDLPPEQAKLASDVVKHLGNAIVDGKIDPHINNEFRQHLYDLATKPADHSDFRGALGQLTRAAQVLDQVELAQGTKLAYDPKHNTATGKSGLPILDVPHIDADLYFQTPDGTLHIESAKAGGSSMANTLSKTEKAGSGDTAPLTQTDRQAQWRLGVAEGQTRETHFFVLDKNANFGALMEPGNIEKLGKAVGDLDARRVVVGDRAYSVNELDQMNKEGFAKAKADLPAFEKQWKADNPGGKFNRGMYFAEHMSTPDKTMATLGKTFGEPVKPLGTPQMPLPTMKQGAGVGAVAGGLITTISLAANGELSFAKAGEVAKGTAVGAGVGAVTAQGERLVTPLADRLIGNTVEKAGTSAATRVAGSTAAEAAGFGAAARTFATRAVGSTAVGVVVSAGVSAIENRKGLMKGDSKAIGNVAADTAVGAASVATSVAVGAAVGSVVPVVGTAVGAGVGLVAGVAVAYGAQISGVRDKVADTVSGWADKVKGWF